MRYPTDNNRITSHYGYRMRNGRQDFHGGTDYGAKKPGHPGDPLHPIANHTRTMEIGYDSIQGNFIIFEHTTHCTKYKHLNKIFVKEGQLVNEDDIIAEMGNSGDSTGAHLHFEVHACLYDRIHERWPNGEAKHTIDPELFFLKYLRLNECQTKHEEVKKHVDALNELYK